MCMYQHAPALSPPCLDAMEGLYDLRADFWSESQGQGKHCHGGFVLGALLVLLFVALRRCCLSTRRRQVRSLLTALNTHPELKAAVEAETGLTVPLPSSGCPCPATGTSRRGGGHRRVLNCLFRAAKVCAFLAFVLLASLAISLSSLEITIRLVQSMDASNDANGGNYTSPLAALLLLFSVCTVQLALLALLVKGVKRCCRPRVNNNTNTTPAPSAPFEPSPSSNGGGLVGAFVGGLEQGLAISTQYLHRASSSVRGGTYSEGYEPLLTAEDREEGREMISQTYARPMPIKAQEQQYAAVLVPIPANVARPVSNISMV